MSITREQLDAIASGGDPDSTVQIQLTFARPLTEAEVYVMVKPLTDIIAEHRGEDPDEFLKAQKWTYVDENGIHHDFTPPPDG